MSNALTQNPIIIDTAGAAAVITQPLRVKKIRWIPGSATDADDAGVVKHKDGSIFWEMLLTDAGTVGQYIEPQESDFNCQTLNGLIVDTLTSGKIFIYVEDNPPYKTT